jgi:hypothetical protein
MKSKRVSKDRFSRSPRSLDEVNEHPDHCFDPLELPTNPP